MTTKRVVGIAVLSTILGALITLKATEPTEEQWRSDLLKEEAASDAMLQAVARNALAARSTVKPKKREVIDVNQRSYNPPGTGGSSGANNSHPRAADPPEAFNTPSPK